MGSQLGIDGVVFHAKRVIPDRRGSVCHIIKGSDPEMGLIAEVYASSTLPGVTKGWKKHLRMHQRMCVLLGCFTWVMYDSRPESPTHGIIQTFQHGPEVAYGILEIPPGLWYAFRNTCSVPAWIINCADSVHDPAEVERLPLDSVSIPFDWDEMKFPELSIHA